MQGSSDQCIGEQEKGLIAMSQAIDDVLAGRTLAHKAQLTLILTYLQENKIQDAIDFITKELTK